MILVGAFGNADTPELFWSEASLQPLYDAIREYVEIDDRVLVLNERLGVVGDLVRCLSSKVATLSR